MNNMCLCIVFTQNLSSRPDWTHSGPILALRRYVWHPWTKGTVRRLIWLSTVASIKQLLVKMTALRSHILSHTLIYFSWHFSIFIISQFGLVTETSCGTNTSHFCYKMWLKNSCFVLFRSMIYYKDNFLNTDSPNGIIKKEERCQEKAVSDWTQISKTIANS